MPIYEYKCAICGEEFEAFHWIADRQKQMHCGEKALLLISKSQGRPVVKEYYSENLDARITGPRQKERIMKERNVSEVGTQKIH